MIISLWLLMAWLFHSLYNLVVIEPTYNYRSLREFNE